MKLKTVKVAGVKYEINVGEDGEFTVWFSGDTLRSDTLKGLLPQLRRLSAKQKVEVAIPAMLIGTRTETGSGWSRKTSEPTCLPITLIGIDVESGNIKWRGADGYIGKSSRWSSDNEHIGKPMTPDEVTEWKRLRKAKLAADDAFSTFGHQFTWHAAEDAVKAALSAKVDSEGDVPDADGEPR